MVLWAWRRTIPTDKELTGLDVRDGLAIVGKKVAGKHPITTIAPTFFICLPCSTLLPPSYGARGFTINEFEICEEQKPTLEKFYMTSEISQFEEHY